MLLFEKSEFEFDVVHSEDDLINTSTKSAVFYKSNEKTASYNDFLIPSKFYSLISNQFKLQSKYDTISRKAVCLFKTRSVYFMPSFGAVISSGGELYKESFEEARWVTPTKAKLPFVSNVGGETIFNPPELVSSIDKAFVCMPLGSKENYGHFLTDCLLALFIFRDFIEKNNITVVVPPLKSWQRRHLELLNINVEVKEINEEITMIGECYHSNIMNHFLHSMTNDISAMAEHQTSNLVSSDINPVFGKKIFLSRKSQPLRQFAQESQLSDELAKLGFSTIVPENMSIEEQIAVFSNAEIIVGATGAGFANTIYCSTGTVIIEIMPQSFDGNIWVRNLCAARFCYWLPIYVPELKPEAPVYVEGVLRSEGGIVYDPSFDIQSIVNMIIPLVKLDYKNSFKNDSINRFSMPSAGENKSLREIAIECKTDKQGAHNYADNYDFHFQKFRTRNVKVLEIGIGGYDDPKAGGESLKMWKKYFQEGLIVGLDFYEKSEHREDRVFTYKGSQDDHNLLNKINTDLGPFDIIIDDGSHMNVHVISSFVCLFPLLKEGGVYAIEDIQTSYWKKVFGGSSTNFNDPATSMGFFKSLVDGLNHKEIEQPSYNASYYDENIRSIHFYHNQVFIYKNKNVDESNVVIKNRLPEIYSSYE